MKWTPSLYVDEPMPDIRWYLMATWPVSTAFRTALAPTEDHGAACRQGRAPR